MGPDGHVLTFAVNGGETLNLMAFRTNAVEWPSKDLSKTTIHADMEMALKDYERWSMNVWKLLEFTKGGSGLLGDHQLEKYNKGRVCVSGDAAHATTPHHGSEACFAIEDSVVMVELLSDERAKSHDDWEAMFAAFDKMRRERSQCLVQISRITGDAYEWRNKDAGSDPEKIRAVIEPRFKKIWGLDIEKMCSGAREELDRRLK